MIDAASQSRSRFLPGLIARSVLSQHSFTLSVGTAKQWARVGSYRSYGLYQIARRMCARTDLARIERLGKEMREAERVHPTSAAKYTNHGYWVPFNVARAGSLGLHLRPPMRIFDIGCGPGYFLGAARACGHEVFGIDAPDTILSHVEQRVYRELLAAQNLNGQVSPLLIEAYVPMKLQHGEFDLITAFWICFNCHRQSNEWGVAEWKFFVDDARAALRSGGVLHLELNENRQRYGALDFYDSQILAYFQSVGTVQGSVVRIPKP